MQLAYEANAIEQIMKPFNTRSEMNPCKLVLKVSPGQSCHNIYFYFSTVPIV